MRDTEPLRQPCSWLRHGSGTSSWTPLQLFHDSLIWFSIVPTGWRLLDPASNIQQSNYCFWLCNNLKFLSGLKYLIKMTRPGHGHSHPAPSQGQNSAHQLLGHLATRSSYLQIPPCQAPCCHPAHAILVHWNQCSYQRNCISYTWLLLTAGSE